MSHCLASLSVTQNPVRTRSPRRISRSGRAPSRPRTSTPYLILAALLVLIPLLVAAPAKAGDELTLRVNDAEGMPGEVIAIEVRTYAPRGVGQGQICLQASDTLSTKSSGSLAPGADGEPAILEEGTEARRGGQIEQGGATRELVASSALRTLAREATAATRPLRSLEGVAVLSALGDAVSSSAFDAGTQTADVAFHSPSATINEADGPLAIFYVRLDDDLEPDQEFSLTINAGATYIVDAFGNQVPLELKPGRLRIEESKTCNE